MEEIRLVNPSRHHGLLGAYIQTVVGWGQDQLGALKYGNMCKVSMLL
jgi:hypothetical protein